MTENVLLASQGIYNRESELFATELLFRSDSGLTALDVGESIATSEVLINHCASITREISHLKRPAFINVNAEFLMSDAFLPVDAAYTYIELVERITVTPKFVEHIQKWRKRGFRFALDDFEFDDSWMPLLDLVDVIKVDVLGQKPSVINARKQSIKDFKGLWLAERVETEEEFNIYLEQGFDLFQGYFLSRPKIIKGTSIRSEDASAVDMLRVTTGEHEVEDIAEVVERYPGLSLQILKVVNSPLYNLSKPIETIKDAIVFLGMAQLRKWALLLSLVSSDNSCIEARRVVLSRAKFCEFYSVQLGYLDPDKAFMVGLLSGIDILLGVAPEEFVDAIQLSEDIADAIVNNEGRMGKVLKLALNLERLIATYPERLKNNKQDVLNVYHESFFWTEDVIRSFYGNSASA